MDRVDTGNKLHTSTHWNLPVTLGRECKKGLEWTAPCYKFGARKHLSCAENQKSYQKVSPFIRTLISRGLNAKGLGIPRNLVSIPTSRYTERISTTFPLEKLGK